MALLADLDAFYLEHRRCGDLDGGVEGARVWMSCSWKDPSFDVGLVVFLSLTAIPAIVRRSGDSMLLLSIVLNLSAAGRLVYARVVRGEVLSVEGTRPHAGRGGVRRRARASALVLRPAERGYPRRARPANAELRKLLRDEAPWGFPTKTVWMYEVKVVPR